MRDVSLPTNKNANAIITGFEVCSGMKGRADSMSQVPGEECTLCDADTDQPIISGSSRLEAFFEKDFRLLCNLISRSASSSGARHLEPSRCFYFWQDCQAPRLVFEFTSVSALVRLLQLQFSLRLQVDASSNFLSFLQTCPLMHPSTVLLQVLQVPHTSSPPQILQSPVPFNSQCNAFPFRLLQPSFSPPSFLPHSLPSTPSRETRHMQALLTPKSNPKSFDVTLSQILCIFA
ncbi:hypothetical protein BDZ45DRAFT_418 [Acephala macrosclerotiorum]|nr:hypothetical protein BDZ45DRAFT_418 [Acephala macrosclerotiorum]